MLGRKKNDPLLDHAIKRLTDEMDVYGPDAPEYPRLVDQYVKLNGMRNQTPRFSYDALIAAGASVACVVILLAFEQKHVITANKALTFIPKR